MWWHRGGEMLLMVLLISNTPPCQGGNILVYPIDGSHWVNMEILLEKLHTRGHILTVLRMTDSQYISENSPLYTTLNIPFTVEGMLEDFEEFLEEHFKVQREGGSVMTFFKMTRNLLSMLTKAHMCHCDPLDKVMEDEEFRRRLKEPLFDMLLTDPALAPGVFLAKYLNLPLVLNVRWTAGIDGQLVAAPSPLSYIPMVGSGLTDKMTFFERIKNVLYYGLFLFQKEILIKPIYSALCDKYIGQPCDIYDLCQEADILLFRSDFVFDFPRPTMPNIIYIGGYQCKSTQPLPADLESFVQSAGKHGVILLSLGTMVKALPTELADEIAAVFAKMPQKVIWKNLGPRPSTLGNNTLMVDWMPQVDLLGHPQTKVLIGHGGTNGIQEAIYHGVPVLGIPVFFDQYDNLLRLQRKGAARILELADFNAENFESNLREMIRQESYRQNIQRLSRLYRDQPMTPMDQAIFWVEHVIRNKGAPHLRTEAYKMPWYSYYCFDVMLLFFTALVVQVSATVAFCQFLFCRKRETKTKQH
ncbi:UDP-glucuronosyltransferase 2C1-like [Neosynchiropus ocellatus]